MAKIFHSRTFSKISEFDKNPSFRTGVSGDRQNSKNWMFGNLRFFGFKFSFLHVYRRNSESRREKNQTHLTFPRNLSF